MFDIDVDPHLVGHWDAAYPNMEPGDRAVFLIGNLLLSFGNFDQVLVHCIWGAQNSLSRRWQHAELLAGWQGAAKLPPRPQFEPLPRDFKPRVKRWRQLLRDLCGEGSALLAKADTASNTIRKAGLVRHRMAHSTIAYDRAAHRITAFNFKDIFDKQAEINKVPMRGLSSTQYMEQIAPILDKYDRNSFSIDELCQTYNDIAESAPVFRALTFEAGK